MKWQCPYSLWFYRPWSNAQWCLSTTTLSRPLRPTSYCSWRRPIIFFYFIFLMCKFGGVIYPFPCNRSYEYNMFLIIYFVSFLSIYFLFMTSSILIDFTGSLRTRFFKKKSLNYWDFVTFCSPQAKRHFGTISCKGYLIERCGRHVHHG